MVALRKLGLFEAFMVGVGGMIGSAIFALTGATVNLAGGWAPISWALASLLVLAISLSYMELASAFPKAGGPFLFPLYTLGPNRRVREFFAYVAGLSYVIGCFLGVVVSALVLNGYLSQVFPALKGGDTTVALLSIVLMFLVNLFGVKTASSVNVALSIFVLIVFASFFATGLPKAELSLFPPEGGVANVLWAIPIAVTGYGAWTAIVSMADRVKNPEKNVPRAVALSILFVGAVYSAGVYVVCKLVPPAEFEKGSPAYFSAFSVAAGKLGMEWINIAMSLSATFAILTTIKILLLASGYVMKAMAEEEMLPKCFACANSRGIPWVAITALTALGGLLCLFPSAFFKMLVIGSVIGTGLPYAINIASAIGLRLYRKDIIPAFRVGGLWVPILGFVALVPVEVGLSLKEVAWSAAVLGLMALSFFLRRGKHGGDKISNREGEETP